MSDLDVVGLCLMKRVDLGQHRVRQSVRPIAGSEVWPIMLCVFSSNVSSCIAKQ